MFCWPCLYLRPLVSVSIQRLLSPTARFTVCRLFIYDVCHVYSADAMPFAPYHTRYAYVMLRHAFIDIDARYFIHFSSCFMLIIFRAAAIIVWFSLSLIPYARRQYATLALHFIATPLLIVAPDIFAITLIATLRARFFRRCLFFFFTPLFRLLSFFLRALALYYLPSPRCYLPVAFQQMPAYLCHAYARRFMMIHALMFCYAICCRRRLFDACSARTHAGATPHAGDERLIFYDMSPIWRRQRERKIPRCRLFVAWKMLERARAPRISAYAYLCDAMFALERVCFCLYARPITRKIDYAVIYVRARAASAWAQDARSLPL